MAVRRNYLLPTLIFTCSLLFFLLWPAPIDEKSDWPAIHRPTAHQQENSYLTPDSTIIYRTFLDYRAQQAAVRILAFRQCVRNESLRMKIEVYLRNGTMISLRPTVKPVEAECPWHWAPSCDWSGHVISAFLPKDQAKAMISASLINWESLLPLSQLNIVQPSKAPQKAQLAICILPLYWYTDWLQLVQFFEIWKLQGASRVFVYYHSISETVDKWLVAYEKEGLVKRIPWTLLPKNSRVDPNLSIYRLGHSLAENDCVYRTMGVAKFVALVDFDEFIIPTSGTLLQYLQSALKKNPSAGSFRFPHFRLAFGGQRPTGKLAAGDVHFNWLLKAKKVVSDARSGPSKTVFLPDRTDVLLTHQVRAHLAGYSQVAVDANEAMLLHARANWQQTASADNGSSATAIRKIFGESLRNAVLMQFRRIFAKYFGRNAKLEQNDGVRKEVAMCLSDWKGVGCKTPYHSCYARVHNMTNWVFSIPERHSGNYLVL
uniref:Glycosyltransferase family 92 protein n=1 Tax=Plectus sambesii TaxID=2011161 RepID=A0A914V1G4_9BILA